MAKLNSYQVSLQAKVLLGKLNQVESNHIKEALIADHLEQLCILAEKFGYESKEYGWQGITEKLYEEGFLK